MPGVSKKSTRMFDGRELIYFDDADTTLDADRATDDREPASRPDVATMRQDPLTGDWISIASARQNRVFLPPAHLDPLAPATPENPSEIPSNYDVVVFENKSPSFGPDLLTGDNNDEELRDFGTIGLGRTKPSVGRCEVVCFSPEHEGSFAELSPSRANTVFAAWVDRTIELSSMSGIQQVFIFENRGQEIGVTLHHPHGQIYAYPFVTPRTQNLLRSIESYGPELMSDILEFERAGERVVLAGEFFTAYVPFAARWPLEIHLMPHRHIPDLAGTSDEERRELSQMYQRLLRAVDALYETPTPYIAAWHQAPVHVGRDSVRFHLEITSPRRAEDKLKYLAGSEAAMGAFIGDVQPEVAAARLREVLEK